MGRTPDYLNVTFACFAGRSDVWARRGNEQGAANLVAYQKLDARPRPVDDALDHEPAGRPHEARGRAGDGRGGAAQDRRDRERHRRPRRAHAGHAGPVRRRADDLPGLRHPPAGRQLRAVVRDPDGHARPQVHLPRQLLQAARPASTTRSRRGSTRWTRWRSSTTSRCPRTACSCDGDTDAATRRSSPTPAGAGHIMHQAFTRAYVKLSFAFGLGHLIANTTGVVRFDHIQEKLGQIWNMVELTRSALVSAEAGSSPGRGRRLVPRRPAVPGAARRDAEVAAVRATSCCS